VRALVDLLESMQVEVRTGEAMLEVQVRDGRACGIVVERDGRARVERADVVVCNADPSTVYRHNVAARWRPLAARRRMRESMSLFVAYFGATATYPELAHHTIVMGPRYRELLDDIFTKRVLADDFSLYLHAPARTDPAMAPPGHEAFYVLSPVPNTRSGIDWSSAAPWYFDRILGALEANVLPGIRERLVSATWMTPDDFARDLRSADGAAFGPEPVLHQSAWFRHHNRSPIDGLYFVGAGTHPGAGVPGVLNSARVLDRVVPAPH
jgi:phytoene desaturase